MDLLENGAEKKYLYVHIGEARDNTDYIINV